MTDRRVSAPCSSRRTRQSVRDDIGISSRKLEKGAADMCLETTKSHNVHHHLVTISINNNPIKVARGRHAVAELKKLGHVPPCDELNEIRHGHPPHHLPDDGFTHIEGGERFESS